jgi:hypothetical protein
MNDSCPYCGVMLEIEGMTLVDCEHDEGELIEMMEIVWYCPRCEYFFSTGGCLDEDLTSQEI